MNIIGNIAMFIPVGIVWPICFKELDSIEKTVLAGAGFSLLIEKSCHDELEELMINWNSEKERVMIENIEVFINNSIRIRDRIGTIYIDPYEMQEESHDADYIFVV